MPSALFRSSQSAPPDSLRASLASRSDDESNPAKPQARQIVSVREQERDADADASSDEFLLHEATLRKILLRKVRRTRRLGTLRLGANIMKMKVAVVSVTGPSRTGKSSLLSLMLQHLSRPSSSHWDTNATSIAFAANIGKIGFAWRSGSDHHTSGVWMWDTPFICTSSSGEDIAVFLVDTQGLFDSATSDQLMQSIFGFTTLLSSTQIYNVSKTVGEDTLQNLGCLAGCSRLVSEITAESSAHPINNSRDDNDAAPFQRVCMLVRDWQSFTKSQTTQEKCATMTKFRDNVLDPRSDPEMTQTHEQLAACFQDVNFFMLPHPGLEVTDPEYNGAVDLIDTKFMELATVLFDELLDPANLTPKTVNGASLTCSQLFMYAKACAGLFQDASRFPDLAAAFMASTAANIENLKAKALKKYAKEMLKFCESGGVTFVRGKALRTHHEECKAKALGVFDEARTVGELSQVAREEIVAQIESEFLVFRKLVRARNCKSAIRVGIATVAVALNVPFADAML